MYLPRLAPCVVSIALLGACASSPDRTISLGSTEYGFHNAGLVVGRAPARGDLLLGDRGLRITVRNDATKTEFSTGRGPFGYTSSDYFAIWLPPGTYSLISVFAHNGSVIPVDEPFKFVVKRGVMMYVGTIVNSWDMPKGVEGLGRALAVKQYGRQICYPPFGCLEMTPPYAQVAVFDEGAGFAQALKAAIPEAPGVALERFFMW